MIVTVLAIIGLAFLFLPLLALLTRLNVAQLPVIFNSPAITEMLWITLGSAFLATVLTVLTGVPIALWLGSKPQAAKFVRSLVYLPLAMPPVVAGLALNAAIGRRGVVAPLLDLVGLQFAFNFAGVVVAHAFIALPFVTIAVDAAYRNLDSEVFNSASAMGMSPWRICKSITLPLLTPAIITGAALAFARSLGEFGTTITFAGSLPGETRTLPIGIYLLREVEPQQAYALAVVLMVVAMASLGLTLLPELCTRAIPATLVDIDEAAINGELLKELSAAAGQTPAITMHSNRGVLKIPAGHCTALVGPNGSGKTTIAQLIAGKYQLGGDFAVVFSTSISQRCIMLTQNPALPPHCTTLQAIAMVSDSEHTAARLLEAAGLSDLGNVLTTQLSGGQAAQVALVRALATKPEVLILDEPLAAIDIASANRWRHLLSQSLTGRTVVLISHNPLEIAALAQFVVSVNADGIHAPLTTEEFFLHPPDSFSAEFIGLNRIVCDCLEVTDGLGYASAGKLNVVGLAGQRLGEQPVALFAPNAVTVSVEKPKPSSARNLWQATITDITSSAGIARITLITGSVKFTAAVTQRAVVANKLHVDQTVYCTVKAVEISFH